MRAMLAMTAATALSACGNTGDSFGSAAQSMATAAIAPMGVAPPAIPLSQAKFAFAPVTGAPATVLINISAQLGKEAFTQQLTLVPTDDPGANYIVKGYLSAIGDASGTVLVYVWDVFDQSGRRVHRISGQEMAAGAPQDPWSSVDNATAADVARQTISAIVAWGKSGQRGNVPPAVTAQPASPVPPSPDGLALPPAPTLPAGTT